MSKVIELKLPDLSWEQAQKVSAGVLKDKLVKECNIEESKIKVTIDSEEDRHVLYVGMILGQYISNALREDSMDRIEDLIQENSIELLREQEKIVSPDEPLIIEIQLAKVNTSESRHIIDELSLQAHLIETVTISNKYIIKIKAKRSDTIPIRTTTAFVGMLVGQAVVNAQNMITPNVLRKTYNQGVVDVQEITLKLIGKHPDNRALREVYAESHDLYQK